MPDWASAARFAHDCELRLWVPCWTIRLCFRAASTATRPSWTLCDIGFSTYTSLPAWHAQTVMSECQWFGVATDTAFSSLSSSALRTSVRVAAAGWPFLASLSRCFW